MPNGGSWFLKKQSSLPRSLLADRLRDTWRDTPESSTVPLGLDSALHSNPLSSPPLLPTLSNPQSSALSPQNNNLPVLPPLPLNSELSLEENNIQLMPPKRTYSRLPSSSTHVVTHLPIHIDGPSTSSSISVQNLTQAAANLFSVEETSLSLSLYSSTASDEEFSCFRDKILPRSLQEGVLC